MFPHFWMAQSHESPIFSAHGWVPHWESIYEGFHSHGYPQKRQGWFFLRENPSLNLVNGWWLGVPLWLRKPVYIYIYIHIYICIIIYNDIYIYICICIYIYIVIIVAWYYHVEVAAAAWSAAASAAQAARENSNCFGDGAAATGGGGLRLLRLLLGWEDVKMRIFRYPSVFCLMIILISVWLMMFGKIRCKDMFCWMISMILPFGLLGWNIRFDSTIGSIGWHI